MIEFVPEEEHRLMIELESDEASPAVIKVIGVGGGGSNTVNQMVESGIDGVEVAVWYGVFAPAKTPPEIVQKVSQGVQRATRDPEVRKRMVDLGADPVGSTPEEFSRLLREEVARWAEVVKISGARAD